MDAGVSSGWLGLLDRHRRRRTQGIPTVTVLQGDRQVAAWLWGSMPSVGGHRWVVAKGFEAGALVAQWVGNSEVASALHAAILGLMANDAGTSTEELVCRLAGRSAWQLEHLAEQTAVAHELELSKVRSAMGMSSVAREPASPAVELLQAQRLLGRVPPLLVDPGSDSESDLCRAAIATVEFAELLPQGEVGLMLGHASADMLGSRVPDRVGMMLKEGLAHLRERGRGLDAPADHGAPVEYDGGAFARSRTERLLFETLDARARTTGVFRLNQSLERPGGGASLEVDLLSQALKLAVEVDGYHHFRDAHGYRRDRRKDVQLQQMGYVVVRVLASDVERELDHVLELIDAAAEHQRRARD
jgi:very-short-patch-repair endonuclease